MKYLLLLLTLLFVCSCSNTHKLQNLSLDMSKEEVVKIMGSPDSARGAIKNRYDQTIEVWEYLLYKTTEDRAENRTTAYWMFFCDDVLVQWGEAGDWNREADRIYEMRFR
ncbi:DUF3192 domain-containing protein [Balneolaceae bacterium ANBcel3]|nr:DUF3192 domain-containing protein [Balneolaceae bacterium ANBcel3]